MAIIQGNAKQGSVRGFYPKVINGSLRFNDDDGAYLSWTPASAGNRKTWTWSGWVKRGNLTRGFLFHAWDGSTYSDSSMFHLQFNSDKLQIETGATSLRVTNAVFRDPSAWYHIVVKCDTTQATAADRLKMYVNGEEITSFSTNNNVAQNTDTALSNTVQHRLGAQQSTTLFLDGYLANVHFIDGQALTADDFGETKNGVWVAKDYAGTFGTNGFYLTFEDDTQVEAFNTVLYRGTGTATGTKNPVTGVGFSPDLIWIKNRDSASDHALYDKVRGVSDPNMSRLESNNTDAEVVAYGALQSVDSDGFTVGPSGQLNASGNNYVAWCWKAGDSNVSNTDGTITSTVRANPTYGFSIVSYTGTGSAGATIGHGLSSAPDFVVIKNRSTTSDWLVYHQSYGATQYTKLNDTVAATSGSRFMDNTEPTTSVFSVGDFTAVNASTNNHIAYCWSETTGYSKFGSYSGDNTTDGSNETTVGFKPAFVIIKNTGPGENWNIYDNTRFTDGDGYIEGNLFASSSSAEVTTAPIEFTATGFAPRASGGGVNASGSTYIYAAFADTREAAFWLDQSGNDNDWQPVNLDHNDTVADSPTNNFATLNPLASKVSHTLSDGNLRTSGADDGKTTCATIGVNSGQFYWEVEFLSGGNYTPYAGLTNQSYVGNGDDTADYKLVSNNTLFVSTRNSTLQVQGFNQTTYQDSGFSITGDSPHTLGFALDCDAGTLKIYYNGSLAYTDSTIPTDGTTIFPVLYQTNAGVGYDWLDTVWNFGQQPFKYDPPA